MYISVDISLYPLSENYARLVKDFIRRIEDVEGTHVVKTTLTTQIFGEFHTIMSLLEAEMKATFEQLPNSIFTLKIVGNDRRPQ